MSSFHHFGKLPRARASSRRWLIIGAGAIVSLLIHCALLTAIALGSKQLKPHVPNQQGAGASAIVSSQEPVMTVIFIDRPDITREHLQSDEEIASRGVTPPKFAVRIASPDPLPAGATHDVNMDRDEQATEAEDAGNQLGHALMFGRYMGQIKARIERAWLRPRSPIGADVFACRILITQDRSGYVLETELQRCNGDDRWQLSLVQAIQTASPLPAPPDPSVFASGMTLEFESSAYAATDGEEGFERETPATLAVAAARQSNEQLSHFSEALRTDSRGRHDPIPLILNGVRNHPMAESTATPNLSAEAGNETAAPVATTAQ